MPFGPLGTQQPTSLILWLLAFLAMATLSQNAKKEDYYDLTDYLFDGYKKEVRPVLDDSSTIQIYVSFSLFQIVEMNEQDQTMKTIARLKIEWLDDYLGWDEPDYGNITSVMYKQSAIWLPDIVVGNTVTTQTQLGYQDLQVHIDSYGWIVWQPTGVFLTSCDIDVTYYPFDTQVCSIVFTSALSTSSELAISIYNETPIDMKTFSPDGIWDVLNWSASNHDEEDGKAKISYSLQLKRRPEFYILNIILPVFFLAMTSPLVFALPAQSGEKMSLSITVLLAFAVYLTLVTDSMPKTSVQVSMLMVYVVQLMALTAFSVILSVPLMRLHHRPSNKPLGRRASNAIIFFRKLMCLADDERRLVNVKPSADNDNTVSIIGENKKQQVKANAVVPYDNDEKADDPCSDCACPPRSPEVSHISGELAAETLNTFLFYLFFLYSIVITIALGIILITGGARQEESTRLS
ncbi:neuronal acetylcholine receptor subunit beta-3-like [Pomacea canaliculata]|uniref:neuronal acetylcholine receptor subunit beta-3-like n=1 Tax=Pomacea canaliculata TaxID=400727 RepID=UPI000D728B9C|nr:neuronal acetylcholine receptor subunit beta-3-like [Pomacea canaliculata]